MIEVLDTRCKKQSGDTLEDRRTMDGEGLR